MATLDWLHSASSEDARRTDARITTANSTLAIGGVSSPLDSFVVAESSVFRTNFCGKSPLIGNLRNVRCKRNETTIIDKQTIRYKKQSILTSDQKQPTIFSLFIFHK
jgi:hypothetical protein